MAILRRLRHGASCLELLGTWDIRPYLVVDLSGPLNLHAMSVEAHFVLHRLAHSCHYLRLVEIVPCLAVFNKYPAHSFPENHVPNDPLGMSVCVLCPEFRYLVCVVICMCVLLVHHMY